MSETVRVSLPDGSQREFPAGTTVLEVAEAIGIDMAMLPRTVEGPEVVATVTDEAAAATGLRAGTPVVGGAGDQAANAVGLGAEPFRPGQDIGEADKKLQGFISELLPVLPPYIPD